MKKSRAFFLFIILLMLACVPSTGIVKPEPKPSYFSNLAYEAARERYRKTVEEKFKQKDLSYILSLLSYGITNFYDLQLDDAKKAFIAAYRIDEGERPEAAKIYDWLVVDSRTVYKLKKRERELVHLYLGLCYLFQNNLEEALVEFKKLRQFDQEASKLPIVNFYMGFIYEKLGKFDDALIEYRGLAQMTDSGSFLFNTAQGLIAKIESVDNSQADSAFVELVVQVEHQSANSIGRTEVYLDCNNSVVATDDERRTTDASILGPRSTVICATLPAIMDSFPVRLSALEANRKAAQEVAAKTTRLGLRLLGWVLLDKAAPGKGKELSDDIADLLLGKEAENRDLRAWGYAPLNFSFARLRILATTQTVRLVFYNRAGDMLGYCDYPLAGKRARAKYADGTYFIVAGLAEEFYVY